tara:strand:- start:284 stop:517 length:234 start_codon:yes stop_codon:yes gene_type:complete
MNDVINEKREMAENLMYSLRGRYLIERAVVVLIRELNQVQLPFKEVSDIADLTLIRTQLLNTFPDGTFDMEKPNAIM